MKLDNKYYFEYIPKDIKSAHALIQRLREKLIKAQEKEILLTSMLPQEYTYKTYEV